MEAASVSPCEASCSRRASRIELQLPCCSQHSSADVGERKASSRPHKNNSHPSTGANASVHAADVILSVATPSENNAEPATDAVLTSYAFPVEENTTTGHAPPALYAEERATNAERDSGAECMSGEEEMQFVSFLNHHRARRRDAVTSECITCGADYWHSFQRPVHSKSVAEEAFLLALTESHDLFASYPPLVRQLFVEAFVLRRTPPGAVLAALGDDDAFHFIVSGSVVAECEEGPERAFVSPVHHSCSTQRAVHRLSAGEDFGREGLFHILHTPAASGGVERWRAAEHVPKDSGEPESLVTEQEEEVVAWVMRRTSYKKIILTYRLNAQRAVRDLLRSSGLPRGLLLSEDRQATLAEAMELVQLAQGTTLLSRGHHAEYVYVLVSGTVEVSQVTSSGALLQVRLLTAGTSACEAEAALGVPSLFDYVVRDALIALRLGRSQLVSVLDHDGDAPLATEEEAFTAVKCTVPPPLPQTATVNMQARLRDQVQQAESILSGAAGWPPVEADDSELDADFALEDCPITIKDEEDTAFFVRHFFSRSDYRNTPGHERGVAMAAFTARRHIPTGSVLTPFASLPATAFDEMNGEESEESSEEQVLYLIYRGTVCVFEHDRPLATLTTGGTVGEGWLVRRRAQKEDAALLAFSGPARSVVTSEDGAEVYCLTRAAYRRLLLPTYRTAQRTFGAQFAVLPFADCFSGFHRGVLAQCVEERSFDNGDVLLAEGNPPHVVHILLCGKALVVRRGFVVSSLQSGDLVGALELVDGMSAQATYCTSQCHMRTLRVPRDAFADLRVFLEPFLQRLRLSDRFRFYASSQENSVQ